MTYTFYVDRTRTSAANRLPCGPWDEDKPRPQTFYLNQAVFILPAKTGQTSFRNALNTSLDEIGSHERPAHLTPKQLKIVSQVYPVVATIRHPFARLVSAYNNKFIGLYKGIEDFIEDVIKTPDVKSDTHVLSMSFLCRDINIDFLVRQEDMEESYQRLRKTFDKLPRAIPHVNKTGKGGNWSKVIPKEYIDPLFKRFEEDFKRFGYEIRPDRWYKAD